MEVSPFVDSFEPQLYVQHGQFCCNKAGLSSAAQSLPSLCHTLCTAHEQCWCGASTHTIVAYRCDVSRETSSSCEHNGTHIQLGRANIAYTITNYRDGWCGIHPSRMRSVMSMEYTFEVTGMTCGHCERAVTQAVQEIDTSAQVQIDRAQKKVVVQTTSSREAVAQAIAEEGFQVA